MSEFEQTQHTQEVEMEQPVHILPEVVERFAPNDPALKHFLAANGFVVVKEVMDQDNIDVAKGKLWEFLDASAGMKYEDKSTWTTDKFEVVALANNGILTFIGQSDFMWYIRLLPRVKEAFSVVHDTDELLCSMDGGNIFLPWHKDATTQHMKTETGWYHVDQGSLLRGLQCVQGLVTLTDVTAGTGGLCLIPHSSACHDELVDVTGEERNFLEVPPSFHALKQKQILPLCKAGDMILWDSRTIHCSTPALEAPTASPDELLRIAAYVCMTPSRLAGKDVIQNRIEAYMREVSMYHWPHIITHQMNPSDPVTRQFEDAPEGVRKLIAGARE